ncbi:MAG: hypothetical protein ACLR3C_13400 [Eggerthella lenta]
MTCVVSLVSAGAGSGRRSRSRSASPMRFCLSGVASGVDEVLAITFTEKASPRPARRALRASAGRGSAARGRRLDIHHPRYARHRAHALDLGLDPAFGIMGDAERSKAVADAMTARWATTTISSRGGSHAALFDEYPARRRCRSLRRGSMLQA